MYYAAYSVSLLMTLRSENYTKSVSTGVLSRKTNKLIFPTQPFKLFQLQYVAAWIITFKRITIDKTDMKNKKKQLNKNNMIAHHIIALPNLQVLVPTI